MSVDFFITCLKTYVYLHCLPLVDVGPEAVAVLYRFRQRQPVKKYVDMMRVGRVMHLCGYVVGVTPLGVVAQHGIDNQCMPALPAFGLPESQETCV